jgi:hypothetical protein
MKADIADKKILTMITEKGCRAAFMGCGFNQCKLNPIHWRAAFRGRRIFRQRVFMEPRIEIPFNMIDINER